MRKTLIGAAVLAAVAVGYYYFNDSRDTIEEPELAYVPADTLIFSGQFKPLDIVNYFNAVGVDADYLATDELQQGLALLSQQIPAVGQFALALFTGFVEALQSPAFFEQTTGLASQSRSLFYMVGAAPVLRLQLADEQQFSGFIDKLAQQSGFHYQLDTLKNHSFRRFRLDEFDSEVELLVSIDRGWATLTLHHRDLPTDHRLQSLAQQMPALNFANSSVLTDYLRRYQLHSDAVGFVSSEQLALALTTRDGNQLAKDIQLTLADHLAAALESWQTSSCQTDLLKLAQLWPGLVMDNQIINPQPDQFKLSGSLRIPTQSRSALEALQTMQGFIPSALQGKLPQTMFYMATGLDVGQLTPAVSQLWAAATDYPLRCEPLSAIQQQMKTQNPLLMLAVAGIAGNGLQGLSVTVNGFSIDRLSGMPEQADALLTLTADNPQRLLSSATALNPMFAGIRLPAVGEEVPLANLLPAAALFDFDLRLRTSEHHLMIYAGDLAKQQASQLATEPLTKNGLLAFGVNYQQFFSRLTELSLHSGQEMPADLQRLMKNTMQMGMSLSIDQHGIVLKTELQTGQP